MAASYKLYVDWQDNGFSDVRDDVTSRVLDQREPVTIKYGRDQARQLAPTSPGEMSFTVNNISRDYSPENTGSPLAGYVKPGRKVLLEATTAGVTSTVYTGYIDDFDVRPTIGDRSVAVTCLDTLGRFRGVNLTTPLYSGIRTGDAIGYLLDAAGWPSDARDIDAGASYLPWWWLDESDAFDALMQIVDSEGTPALVTIDTAGRVVFRDRHHRLTRSASLTAQATWRSSVTEPIMSEPMIYNHGWREIVNSADVQVSVRQVSPALSQVWTSEGLTVVPANTPVTITARSDSPFTGALTPVQDTDYTLVSGTVSVSISQTSGQSTVITLSSVAGAIVQDLALRALALTATTQVVSVSDTSSIARYGQRSLADGRQPVWANPYDVQAILQLIIAKRGDRLPTLTVTMRGGANASRLTECLTRDLSDRIRVTETLSGIDSDCFIEQISHTIGQGGKEHVTTFGLEKAPTVPSTPFTFDTAGQGFDQGTFVGTGLDDPADMFRFNTGGQGFDEGVFVY